MKKTLALFLTLTLVFSLSACSKNNSSAQSPSASESLEAEVKEEISQTESAEKKIIKIAALKGPTGMGFAPLIEKSDNGETSFKYELTLCASPDEIAPLLLQNKVDFASLPSNLSANLYNRLAKENNGQINAVAINTVGNLSVLTKGEQVTTVSDLKGKTVLSSGKGASPEAMFNYLLLKNGIDSSKDIEVIYKTEHSECLSALLQQESGIAILPQPFATTAMLKDENLKYAFDFNEEWKNATDGNQPITGVLVGKAAFINSNKEDTKAFLKEYEEAIKETLTFSDEVCASIEKLGIIPAKVAKKALPLCGITFVTDSGMKDQLSSYLQVLYDFNPKLIGGEMPNDDFYFAQ